MNPLFQKERIDKIETTGIQRVVRPVGHPSRDVVARRNATRKTQQEAGAKATPRNNCCIATGQARMCHPREKAGIQPRGRDDDRQ
jgi:hypothetical protein